MELTALTAHRLIPVVVINDSVRARPLGEALVSGGLPIAEVTFRTAAAADSIRAMASIPDLIVGAGTILNARQVDEAVDAGATFIVSPGLSADVVRRAQELNVPVIPGAVTPSEIMAALDLGIRTVKFFPANVYGGAAAIRSLAAPFTQVSFIPTGGVSRENVGDFLSLPMIPAVGGSWMVPAAKIDAGDFDSIVTATRAAVDAVADFR